MKYLCEYKRKGAPPMALNDVEHCEACQIHEDVVKAVTDHMPDEDQLYDLAEVF